MQEKKVLPLVADDPPARKATETLHPSFIHSFPFIPFHYPGKKEENQEKKKQGEEKKT